MENELKSLKVEREGRIAEVILLGPGRGNALGPDFWREAPEVFRQLDADPDVFVIILRGAGENFSFGLDLKRMMADLAPVLGTDQQVVARARLLEQIHRMQGACDSIANCRKPVLAAIHGYCIGGGLNLIAACDARYASTEAKFSLREVKLAMVADLGALQRLPNIIGEGHTRELAYTGMDIDATRALRIGLVNEMLPSPQSMLALVRETARFIAENPPLVVQGIKQVMQHCEGKTVADGMRYVATWNAGFLQSRDLAEAVSAFMERRTPRFTGE